MKKRLRVCAALLIIYMLLLFSGNVVQAASSLDEAKYLLNLYYVEDLSVQAMKATSMHELISAIDDPYTTYMSPEAYKQFVEAVENSFSGIGITVEQVEDGILILSVIKESGAEEAGLKPGDIILEADGHVLAGMDLSEALTYIKGEEGTFVYLKIKRENEVFNVLVQRRYLKLPTVEGKLLDGNIAYIRIYSFGSDTDEHFERYLKEFESKDPAGYIIDIRSNGGGYVDSTLKIAGHFIGSNVAMLAASKWGIDRYTALDDNIVVDRPVFLLVDMFSASASEILAGALQDYNKAILVGERTYGKGSMQSLFPLSDGGALKLTTNYIYTPKGRIFNELGLEPDVKIENEAEPYYAVLLLLNGDAENRDSKEEFMAIDIKGKIYDIDLKKARQDEYWEGYRAIINDALAKRRSIFIGTSAGWKVFEEEGDIYRYYFPDYKELPLLADIVPDKVFSVTFSKPINPHTLDNRIYLINSNSGERVNCEIREIDNLGKTVKLAASQLLERGREYYLVMDKGIQATDGEELKQGALCRVVVMK